MSFKSTDFVQILHQKRHESGEINDFWRNALYVTGEVGYHIVIYTDGTRETLFSPKKIRKARTDNGI